jgi:hypothetical protein
VGDLCTSTVSNPFCAERSNGAIACLGTFFLWCLVVNCTDRQRDNRRSGLGTCPGMMSLPFYSDPPPHSRESRLAIGERCTLSRRRQRRTSCRTTCTFSYEIERFRFFVTHLLGSRNRDRPLSLRGFGAAPPHPSRQAVLTLTWRASKSSFRRLAATPLPRLGSRLTAPGGRPTDMLQERLSARDSRRL